MGRKYRKSKKYKGGNYSSIPLLLNKPIDSLGSSQAAIETGNMQMNQAIDNKKLMGGSNSVQVPSFPEPPGGSITSYDANYLSKMVNSQNMQANEDSKNDFYAYQAGGKKLYKYKKQKSLTRKSRRRKSVNKKSRKYKNKHTRRQH